MDAPLGPHGPLGRWALGPMGFGAPRAPGAPGGVPWRPGAWLETKFAIWGPWAHVTPNVKFSFPGPVVRDTVSYAPM